MTVVSNVYHQLVARLFGRAVLTALCLSLSLGASTALSQETSQPSKSSHTEVSETDASCTPPRLAQSPRTVLRVGYSAFNLSGDKELLLPSLQKVFSPDRLGQPVLFEEFSEDELQRAIESNEVDAVLSSSGFYRQNTTHGLRSLATVVCDEQPDPNHNEGALIIVNAQHLEKASSDVVQPIPLEAIRGLKLLANSPTSFSGYQVAMREVAKHTSQPERFFASETFFQKPLVNREILEAVANGEADVGFLPLCAYEQLQKTHPDWVQRVRVVNEKYDDVTACRHSTELYPSLTLSVTPSITASLSRELTVALLNEPKSKNGLMWGVASDFKGVDDLLKELKLGPFEYLRGWGLKRIWSQYWWVLVGTTIFILLLVGHSVRANVLVRRKEAEVRALLNAQSEQKAKFAQLQKAGAVGQISSLVAHELRQPLGAITLYAEGLMNMSKTQQLTTEELEEVLAEIVHDATRANTIVERVRQYAKKDAALEVLDMIELLAHIETIAPKVAVANVKLQFVREENEEVHVFGNRLEIEMAILNLIKNAMEAASERTGYPGQVTVWLAPNDVAPCSALIAVVDNGPEVSDAVFSSLHEPVTSLKPEGLGLGLSIAKNSVEALGGHIRFIRNRDLVGPLRTKSEGQVDDCVKAVLVKLLRIHPSIPFPTTGLTALMELPRYRKETNNG